MNSINTVAAELGLRLVVPEHDGVPLTASLHYRAEDPYAIRMAFHVGMDEPVEWIFARDLLAGGMTEPPATVMSACGLRTRRPGSGC